MNKKERKGLKVLKIIGMVAGGIALAALLGFVIMWLWNWLMPAIFGLGVIGYWQGVGIAVLGRLIFGGFGGGGGHDKDCDRKSAKEEFKSEFRKEFKKEFKRSLSEDGYDEAYEEWWKTEGEKGFEDYMKTKQQEKDEEI